MTFSKKELMLLAEALKGYRWEADADLYAMNSGVHRDWDGKQEQIKELEVKHDAASDLLKKVLRRIKNSA